MNEGADRMGSLLAVGYLALFAFGAYLAIKHRDKPAPLPAPGLMPGISNPATWAPLVHDDFVDAFLEAEIEAFIDDVLGDRA